MLVVVQDLLGASAVQVGEGAQGLQQVFDLAPGSRAPAGVYNPGNALEQLRKSL